MSTLREAAEKALMALTFAEESGRHWPMAVKMARNAAIEALRAALSAAPAPQPAGGEPVAALIRHRSLRTEARIAHDRCDHYSDWSDWEPSTVDHALAVTDPARNTNPHLWEARLLVDCQPQPAAQQEPLFWYRPRSDGLYEGPIHNAQIERARKESGGWVPLYTQAGERKPLTDEQIDRHSIAAVDCPPSSTVILVSSLRRLLGITDTKGDNHA